MPYSADEGKDWFVKKLTSNSIFTVLDVGPGAGIYGQLVNKNMTVIGSVDAVEVWEPYIRKFNLNKIYTHVAVCDIRDWSNFSYDLVIFGDVLEHMSRDDARAVWDFAAKRAKFAYISIPIVHYPQGEYDGNPYEEHVEDHWHHEEILDWFPGIVDHEQFSVVGSYWADFR